MNYKPTDEAVEKLVNIIDASNPYAQNVALDILTAIRADLSVFFPVKELEWKERECGGWKSGYYTIGTTYGMAPKELMLCFGAQIIEYVRTEALAKAAAQAHCAALADGMRA